MINIIFLSLFFTITGLNIILVALKKFRIRRILNPLIIPMLILYYIFSVPFKDFHWLVILGLICCLIGNYFFMSYQDEEMFLNGIIVLLIGNFFYIISFTQTFVNISGLLLWKFFLLIPGLLIILYSYSQIKGEMEIMQMAMFIYIAIMTIMYCCAVFRMPASGGLDYWFVWIGATLFMLSSAIIAIDTFSTEIPSTGVYILSTFYLAQFFIVQGIIFS